MILPVVGVRAAIFYGGHAPKEKRRAVLVGHTRKNNFPAFSA
jgi:hypothetical protein